MNYKKLMFLVLFIILSATIVHAEAKPAAAGGVDRFLEPVLKPFHGVNVGQTYERYYYFVDAVLFFILFIGVAKFALKDKFGASAVVPIVIGIILAIGMAVFEKNSEFNIGKMWWLAALIFFAILGAVIYNLAKSAGANGILAFSVAYMLIYLVIQNTANELLVALKKLEIAGGILGLLFFISIIGIIYGLVLLVKGIKTGEWQLGRIGSKEKDQERQLRREEKDELKALKKQRKVDANMTKLKAEAGDMEKKLKDLEDIETRYMNDDLVDRQKQIELLIELENWLNQTFRMQSSLQKAYDNMDKPEYATHGGDIEEYTIKLNNMIGKLQEIFLKLREAIAK